MAYMSLALLLAMTPILARGEATMCKPSETVYFSCQTTGAKSIGLCGAALQYRFGKPGKPEFAFPANRGEAVRSMRLTHHFRYQVDRIEVSFSNQGNDYALYDYTESGKRSAGVRVVTPYRKEIDIACRNPAQSRLGELDGVLGCDADNALSMGAFPAK